MLKVRIIVVFRGNREVSVMQIIVLFLISEFVHFTIIVEFFNCGFSLMFIIIFKVFKRRIYPMLLP